MEWTQILEAVEHPIYGCEAQKKTTVSVQKPIPSSYESGIVMARYGARREHGAIVQRMASSCMQKIKNLAMMEGKMMGPEAWQEALECVFDELDGKDLSALLDSFNVPVNSTRSQAFDMVSASVMQRYMVEDCTGEFKQVCAISTAVKTAEECNFSNPGDTGYTTYHKRRYMGSASCVSGQVETCATHWREFNKGKIVLTQGAHAIWPLEGPKTLWRFYREICIV